MVITCPNCQAKYKLPGKKLEGRGAKITCPRCSHIFVIFNKDREATGPHSAVSLETDAIQPASRRVTPPGPARGSASGTAPAPVAAQLPGGLRAEDIFSTDYAEEADERGEPDVVPGGASEPPSFGVQRGRPAPEEVPSGPQVVTEKVVVATDVEGPSGSQPVRASESLDFRGLGIDRWKVKVAIGLTYDFADIATLRRSIRNGKVTAEDQISHDGREWSRIGNGDELEDYLARVFGQVQTEAGLADAATGAAKTAPAPPPSEPGVAEDAAAPADGEPPANAAVAVGTSSASLAALNKAALDEIQGGDALKVDLSRRRRRRRKKPPESKKRGPLPLGNPLLVGVVVVLALLLIGVLVRSAMRGDGEDTRTRSSISDAELEKIRQEEAERIQRELDKQREKILAEEELDGGTADVAVDSTPQPIEREDATTEEEATPPTAPLDPEAEAAERERREEARKAREEAARERREKETTPAETDDGDTSTDGGDQAVEIEETTAEDWAFLGDSALGGGDCTGGINSFREALKKAPGNANYNYKMGLSYHRCGKKDSAVPYLEKAAGSVQAAQDLLDQIQGADGA